MRARPSHRVLKYGGLGAGVMLILVSVLLHGVVITGAVLGLIVLVLVLM